MMRKHWKLTHQIFTCVFIATHHEQRVNSLKNILVCLYGSTGSLWNRFGNVLAFEEINRLSREVLIKTKDIVQGLGYEVVYADTGSVFIKKKDTAIDYNELIDK